MFHLYDLCVGKLHPKNIRRALFSSQIATRFRTQDALEQSTENKQTGIMQEKRRYEVYWNKVEEADACCRNDCNALRGDATKRTISLCL